MGPSRVERRAGRLSFNQNITFEAVSFRYFSHGPDILATTDLSILKGKKIGIVGKSGSGKSTVLDIIMGLLTPTTGAVKVDGIAIDPATVGQWQANVAHVPQSIFLADCTVAQNIAFGIPVASIDLARVIECASAAQVAESIELLPQRYETWVGERGVRLSGGQRQRIGIARALYKQAEILIFDEATSALDEVTELEVMNSIYSLNPNLTILIASHRLSTLSKCDFIIELLDSRLEVRSAVHFP